MTKKTTKKAMRASVARAAVRRQSAFPAHLQTTPDEWRALKRTEWREVMHAIDRYTYGAAYCPSDAALYHLGRLARQIQEALEPPDWIAW